jgi:gas vesicle protein
MLTKQRASESALVGLLFAPASGKKTRHYITRTVKQGLMMLSRRASDGLDAPRKQ